ncbi:hypothetical protein DSO57_1015406 [Entomophthora muscae]|uniref:Uncharacterized protein n=1 Tax=Entomophthora muscae TaxID=34485 RepID=A0ACC2SHY2_9FUNG|nr:hypothetical protein DSO57_1015406 [Entomophthora muscae]
MEYNLETILIADPLARTRETEYIGREGKWYKRPPRLFKDNYNYLPAYFIPMTPLLTPQPYRPMETPTAAETTSTQLFGVLYITLTGIVDSMIPISGPWPLLGQPMSYIIKLAPILWWALPAGSAQPHPEPPNASTYAWFPDKPDHLDPEWPNLYNTEYKTKGKDPSTHQLTHNTLVRNKNYLHVSNGTVYQIINSKHVPYIPLAQRVDTILRHHRLLGHTKANNLYLTLKEILWWPNLKQDIVDVLKKCTVCKKYTSTKVLSQRSTQYQTLNHLRFGG